MYLWKFILMFMLLWFFWYIFYWLFRKYVGNVCIHMHVCMYLFCMYATHVCVHICIHANMYGCVHVCIYGHVYLHVCADVCILCVCICVLSVPIHLHACLCSPTNLSSGCIYIRCHQLVLLSSLSQDILSFLQYLSVISSYCLTASFRTIMNSEDRGSLTLCILVGMPLIFTLLCVRLDYQ